MGVINRRLVFSCHPFFVVCQRGVAAAFETFNAAQKFLADRGFRAGLIYRHNGHDWDKVESEPCFLPPDVFLLDGGTSRHVDPD